MIEQRIQNEAYWLQDFAVTDQDIEELQLAFLEAERPMEIGELAQSLVAHRCMREERTLRRQLAQGTLYRPNGSFAIGETLVFAHLDFAVGKVVDLRDGHNPEYGDFKVVAVEFDDSGKHKPRSFAAELQVPHKLCLPDGVSPGDSLNLSPESLYRRYGDAISLKLASRLESAPGFVRFRDQWLGRAMLADLHVGYLNIAEAVIDVNGKPLRPDALLDELDLPAEIPQSVRIFSLNHALAEDGRFDDVGDRQQVLWSLKRWQPATVLAPPAWSRYEPVPYNRTDLDVTHLQLEREMDDEFSDLMVTPTVASAQSIRLILTFPHWCLGTVPLTDRTRRFFPLGTAQQHTQITWIDRATRVEFPGWVAHGHRFVYGLEEWYRANEIPVGAYIVLERQGDPHRVSIGYAARRMQREWTRVIFRDAEGHVAFQLQKRPVACEYDELCLMGELDRGETELLRSTDRERDLSLGQTITEVFEALAKLSSDGMVHAKTLYTAVNVLRRCPPGLVFATLFEMPQFILAGNGTWLFQRKRDVI